MSRDIRSSFPKQALPFLFLLRPACQPYRQDQYRQCHDTDWHHQLLLFLQVRFPTTNRLAKWVAYLSGIVHRQPGG